MLTDTSAQVRAERPVRPRRRFSSHWGLETLIVALLAGAVPLLLAGHYHSLGLPSEDDWSYLASLAHLAQHGSINLNHWSSTFEIGQLLLACPLYLVFGVHPVLAVLWVWAMGVVGIAATAYLARAGGVTRRHGLVLVAALSLCPLFLEVDTTFMTDVPSYTVAVLALCVWVRCQDPVRFDRRRWLALALVTVAFTIREPMACAAIPVFSEPILVAYRQGDRRRSLTLGAGAVAWLIFLVVLYEWRQGLPSGTHSGFGFSLSTLLAPLTWEWLPSMVGLFLSPVVCAIRPWRSLPSLVRRRPRYSLLVVGLTCGIPLITLPWREGSLQIGNLVAVDAFLPGICQIGLTVLGLISFAVIAVMAPAAWKARHELPTDARRQIEGVCTIMVAYIAVMVISAGAGAMAISTSAGRPVWDRYWFVVIALAAIALSRTGPLVIRPESAPPIRPSRRAAPLVALAVLAFYALAVATDTAALRYGSENFATAAVSDLPAGYGALDITVSMPWDGLRYATSPNVTNSAHGSSDFDFFSHDQAGSFIYSDTAHFWQCAPFEIRTIVSGYPVPTGTIDVSSLSRGLFADIRFALVRLPAGSRCVDDF